MSLEIHCVQYSCSNHLQIAYNKIIQHVLHMEDILNVTSKSKSSIILHFQLLVHETIIIQLVITKLLIETCHPSAL